MRSFWRLVLATLVGAGLLAAAEALSESQRGIGRPSGGSRPGPGTQGGQGARPSGGGIGSPPVIIRQRQYHVPAAPAPRPSGIVREPQRMAMPSTGADGRAFTARPQQTPPTRAGIIRDPGFTRQIGIQRTQERVPGRFFWHRFRGVPYCHSFWGGVDWYGFYIGPSFYWTRFHSGFWWWYDPRHTRWVYWYNDYWWWPGPEGRLFVYVDDNYYPYDSAQGAVTVKKPEVVQPPPDVPPPQAGHSVVSPDQSRMVQIMGGRDEAFLYDSSGQQPVFMKFLGKDVKEAGFTKAQSGKGSVIILTFKDGSFALFDGDGNPLDRPKPGGGG